MGVLVFHQNYAFGSGRGWAEDVALVPASTSPGLIAACNALAAARLPFLAQDCAQVLTEIRNTDHPRDSLILNDFIVPGTSTQANVDEIEQCIETRLSSTHNAFRSWWSHGVGSTFIVNNKFTAGFLASADYTAYLAWLALLNVASNFGIQRLGSQNAGIPITAIVNVALGGPGQITTATPHGITGLTRIQIRGYRGFPARLGNGFWNVVPTGANTLLMQGSSQIAWNEGPGAQLWVVTPTVDPMSFANGPTVGNRKVGKVINLPRGRKPAFLLHH